MLRSITGRFYATAFLLVLVFTCAYFVLSYFLAEQNKLASQMMINSEIERKVRSLNGLFYEIRFWERKILEDDNSEANTKFGETINLIKTRLSGLHKNELPEQIQPTILEIQHALSDYEKIFNRFIQLKTSRNLHQNSVETSYQSLVSNVMHKNEIKLFKSLYNLTHFFINYLMHQNDNVYRALLLVTDYLGNEIETSKFVDQRTKVYLTSFKEMIQKDYGLSIEMGKIKFDFDRENERLLDLFESGFKNADILFKRDFSTAESKRKNLNQIAFIFISITILITFMIFFIFSKSIVTPIRSISKTMYKVKSGEANARFTTQRSSKDELIKFGLYFNTMLDALQENEKKYRDLFSSSLDAIFLYDPTQGYIDCNPAAMEMFNIQSKGQLGQISPDTLFSHDHCQDIRQSEGDWSFQKELEGKGDAISEWTFRRLSGKEFYGSMMISRIKIGGQTIIQKTIRDITEQKQAQEMMIQSEKMLSVGGLAAGMAHEINNPLAGMIQNASVMESRLGNLEMPANLKVSKEIGIKMKDIKDFMTRRGIFEMIDVIHESGARAAKIVNSMLSFARKSNTDISSEHPDELLDKIIELAATDYDLKKHYDFKSIKIIKQYDDNLSTLRCEAAKIQQVFLNILRNGAQAMQAANIASPQFILRIYSERDPAMTCIEIEDNGPGMDEATRSKVFDPFFTTKPVGDGTGLGLSVSYFIITENHNGTMEVISEPGHGATFIIRLPV